VEYADWRWRSAGAAFSSSTVPCPAGTLSGAILRPIFRRWSGRQTIQAILGHSNIGITQNIYIKALSAARVTAMDSLSEKLGIYNDPATTAAKRIQ
jgi:integrase